jgi:hypothetical protein
MGYWSLLRPLIIVVACYAIFQAATGFDTILNPLTSNTDEAVAAAGGYYRNGGEGEVLVVGSTLYGGRLALYGSVWVIISLAMMLFNAARNRRLSPVDGLLVGGSLICVGLGQNRTALIATAAAAIVLLIYASSVFGFTSRLFRLGVVALPLAALVLLVFGWALNRNSARLSTTEVGEFLGQIADPDQYDVAGTNTLDGMKTIYQLQGFWGAGTGTLVPSFGPATDGATVFSEVGAEGIVLRLLYEFGVPGLIFYFLLFSRLIYILARRARQLRRYDAGGALMLVAAAAMVFAYLVLGYKHEGFAQDATYQTYVFAFVGSVFGSTAQRIAVLRPLQQRESMHQVAVV